MKKSEQINEFPFRIKQAPDQHKHFVLQRLVVANKGKPNEALEWRDWKYPGNLRAATESLLHLAIAEYESGRFETRFTIDDIQRMHDIYDAAVLRIEKLALDIIKEN